MYSLFVSFEVADRQEGTFEIGIDRFLEYTNTAVSTQVRSLSNEIVDCLKSWPCLLMEEGRGAEEALVTKIVAVKRLANTIYVTFASAPTVSPIRNSDLWILRKNLGIEQFEFARNHWALKNHDLVETLEQAGFELQDTDVACFQQLALPSPARSSLIHAKRKMSEWSHSDIDDFLLESGVSGLTAGREIGSRRDRANAIVEFSIDNPAATTAENNLFSMKIARAGKSPGYEDFAGEIGETHKDVVDRPQVSDFLPETASISISPNRVFIVHGRNDTARTAIVSFLTSVGLEGVVLHEQPNMGRHLLTKFIDEAELVTFAIVLMTDDDTGSAEGGDPKPRARQNVILELGYFLAHLGQPRVCALITPGLETPSDFDGIVYIRMDDENGWQAELLRELKAAGMPVASNT